MPDVLPKIGAICAYFVDPAGFASGAGMPGHIAWVSPAGDSVNVAYLDTSGSWFKDGPVPFLQSGQALPARKGFCCWTSYVAP